MVIAFDTVVKVYRNERMLRFGDELCAGTATSFALSGPVEAAMPNGKSIKHQSLHLGDVNINGYPDLLLILIDNEKETPVVFENRFAKDGGSFAVFDKPSYNSGVLASIDKTDGEILSTSFIDIL